jgi:succinate-semialdehyde dehydrogenase/glutarate-semialdehyde dehydrogenase
MASKPSENFTWLESHAPQNLFIDNSWVRSASSDWLEVINPADESLIARVPRATKPDVDRVLVSTQDAQKSWSAISSWRRAVYLRAIAEIMRRDVNESARVMTLEQGKPLEQAVGEILAAADQFDWNADEARRVYGRIVSAKNETDHIFVYKQPIGPVAAFAPWNFPTLLPARKISAALAAGCAVIAMPAQESPLSCLLIAKAALEADLPPGVLNMITGDPVLISQMLIDSDVVRKISLTGSVPVGAITLARASNKIKPVTVELGGHSAVIVLKDANIDVAAKLCAIGKYRNAGQVCISASRFFVDATVADQFIEKFLEYAKTIRLGSGLIEGTDMGPLGSSRRIDVMEEIVSDAKSKGAQIALGGAKSNEFESGYYFEPTVLLNVNSGMRVMQEETFGPIAPIARFDTIEEAISLANQTPFGLAGFIFTEDLNLAIEIGLQLEVGMVGVNNLTIATAEAPFGGVKASGFGREGGAEGIEDFLVTKYFNSRMKRELK